jgi:anti-anti-sigma factor
MSQAFEVHPDRSDPRRFRLIGELDLSGAEALLSAVEGGNGDSLVFDLTELTFVDSSGISAFVRIAHDRMEGETLVLDGPRPEVKRVLDLVGLSAAHNLEVRPS